MKCPVSIQMATYSVGVECNKKDIGQLSDQLQMCIRQHSAYWFLQYQHVILNRDEGLVQWSAIVVIDLRQSLIVNQGWVEHELLHHT